MTHFDDFGMAIGAVFVVGSFCYLAWVLIHPARF